MKRGLELVHEKKKPSYCDICDYSYSQKGDLKKHLELVHEKKKQFNVKFATT